jgi:hypothetical protein
MSVYKQFTNNDIILNVFEANKLISFSSSDISDINTGIEFYTGKNISKKKFPTETSGFNITQSISGVYNNIKHSYYSNYLISPYGDPSPERVIVPGSDENGDKYISSGSNINGPRFENYLQTDLSYKKLFPTHPNSEISVISIPKSLIGENIVPSTLSFNSTRYINDFESISIKDDGEGNLLNGEQIIGNIFYSHGICVFTTGSINNWFSNYILDETNISYSSSFKIYESQYKCVISENEFNFSLNPSLISGSSDDKYYDFVTSSIFTPYITTIGMYNNDKELMAVAKLSQPIPISKLTDTTIIISYDI